MKIQVRIEPTFSLKWPKVHLKFNNYTLYNGLCEPNSGKYFAWTHHAETLVHENKLSIEHYDKDGKETITDDNNETSKDRAIILKSIIIDGHDVPEVVLFDKPFYINWTERQIRDQKHRPKYIKNNLYFGFNGTYEYTFEANSEQHYYNNLIEKERLANISNKKEIIRPDGKKVEAFEFTGKLVESGEKESMTIEELYKRVVNEN